MWRDRPVIATALLINECSLTNSVKGHRGQAGISNIKFGQNQHDSRVMRYVTKISWVYLARKP
jgi:hypothetical protein